VKANPHTDRLLIEHMLGCIAPIFEYTGGDREAFFRAWLVQDAAILKARVQTA
jgi:uncharacterized protein with HEPN domain